MQSACAYPKRPDRNTPRASQPNNWNHPIHGYRRRFTTTTDAYAHELYFDAVGSPEVEAFLQESDQYDTTEKKWSLIAMSGTTERLIGATYYVLRSIVERFVRPEEAGVEREVTNTLNTPACEEKNEDGVRACPTLLVRASGSSFQTPEALVSNAPASSCFGFSDMATYFSVKLEPDIGTEKDILDEMSSYARRIFRDQPNRIFVRSLCITERHARLVHFDRAGSQISPPLDLHRHPTTFIRLVAGLSSTSERLLGLDDSIQWTILNGRKTQGTLTTTGPSGERTTYPLLGQMATARDSIRGRATTCWRVRDPESSEEYVVKDSWRPDDRTSEHEFLKLVKGIPGVVQMITCESNRGETKDFRCSDTFAQYHNRIFGRVTMKSYGKPLMHFPSALQLLCALRDAIAAHQKLVGDGLQVLHCDISHNNILLGKDGAPEGERGIIIDFDMAFRATEDTPKITVDHHVGTRLFQSIRVLGTYYPWRDHPARDYLDDLESFLYLLTYVFLLCKPDGSRLPSTDMGPSIVKTWADEDIESAYNNKRELYGVGGVAHDALLSVDKHWGSTCSTLFDTFSWWILDKRGEKSDLLIGPDATGAPDALDPLLARRDEHYTEVLAIFDEAIEAIQESGLGEPNFPETPDDDDSNENSIEEKPGAPAPKSNLDCTHVPSTVFPVAACTPAAAPPPADELPHDIEMGFPVIKQALKTSPPPSVAPAHPRRSARIRNLQLAKGRVLSPLSRQVPPLVEKAAPIPMAPLLMPQPRRSDRIRKRRLEDDEPLEVALTGARPKKKRARVTTRRR